MTGDDVKIVAVVGAGTMGPGMAATFARYGFETRLTDVKPEMLDKAKGTVEVVYKTLISSGFMTEADAEAGRRRLRFTFDLDEALAGAQFVLESVPEKLEIKQAVFKEVEGKVADDVVLASNTSGIPITRLQEAVKSPGRVVGMHWSNPPHLIPVIEVIRGAETEDATLAATYRITERLGMIPVLIKKDVPGFVENRILYAIMREALELLDQGVADARDIDEIVKWGIGYKIAVIPPLQLLDVAGLDIYHAVASYLNADLSDRKDIAPIVQEKVAKGELGLKTGKGLFDYGADEIPGLMQKRMRLLLASRKALND